MLGSGGCVYGVSDCGRNVYLDLAPYIVQRKLAGS